MGLIDYITGRNKELAFMFDFELIQDTTNRIHMKKLAIETCINMIARTISQSEFRFKKGKETIKDERYYRFNVKPNKNMTASMFWQTVIYKLVYDNECLIIKTDDDDLLVADDFMKNEYAIFEDTFSNVIVKEYEFKRTFKRSEVFYIEYGNEKLSGLIDSLFADYGELFGRLLEFQKIKNQVRGSLEIEAIMNKDKEAQEKLQSYVDKVLDAVSKKAVAVFPLQKGITYTEHSKDTGTKQSVDEINKVTDGFLEQVARALGIPVALLRGDMADIEKQTRNYMTFCIDPLLKKITDELNGQLFTKKEFLEGQRVDIRRITYSNLFDVATAIDKLIASGAFNGDEIRDEVGYEPTGEPIHTNYFITKNYQESSQALEGG